METGEGAAKRLCSISPKQPSGKSRRDWYPYYAGFTQEFVDALISEHLQSATFVVDPWSGSGTTTATCLKRGVASRGIDINPALTVIARARLTPVTYRPTIDQVLREVANAARGTRVDRPPTDVLESWLAPAAAARIRSLRGAIHSVLGHSWEPVSRDDLGADGFSPLVSFFYCALFGVARTALRRYGATNPMWLKYPPTPRHRVRPSTEVLHAELCKQVGYLARRLCLTAERTELTEDSPFATGNATCLPFDDNLFDGAVTSPPYATRLDYVKGTLPELAVLGADKDYLDRLRSSSTGSPKVKGVPFTDENELASRTASNVLAAIGSHDSKGSRSYYLPWMANYLGTLQAGLRELSRTVRADCPICIVVQDSYYKEMLVEMQRIVIEMMSDVGRTIRARYDYPAPNRRRKPSRAKSSSDGMPGNLETLLVFA